MRGLFVIRLKNVSLSHSVEAEEGRSKLASPTAAMRREKHWLKLHSQDPDNQTITINKLNDHETADAFTHARAKGDISLKHSSSRRTKDSTLLSSACTVSVFPKRNKLWWNNVWMVIFIIWTFHHIRKQHWVACTHLYYLLFIHML